MPPTRAANSDLPDQPTLQFETEKAFETWLAKHHGKSTGVWLRLAKKDAATATVTYAQAIDVALCYGWIDGQKQSDDNGFWLQRFTPRGARSGWSKINRDKALALIESGRMQAAGLAEIERAKADGRWESAYDSASTATVPEDLQRALDANARARAFFPLLNGANRYAVLYRVQTAKKPETRARRIAQLVDMLSRHETIHPQPGLRPAEKR